MSRVRATGLTFAPEAGTQRMRDVINKNVTEEDITASAEKIFSRGWSRMKCYFMIGLPTETDEDVAASRRPAGASSGSARKIRKDADVTVSVSSHVPKPHTPFQWCAMDSIDEIQRKQRLLRDLAQQERVDAQVPRGRHQPRRGHPLARRSPPRRRHRARRGATARASTAGTSSSRSSAGTRRSTPRGVDPRALPVDTIPVDARLPWDHIDVGLAEGFLAWEYRRALKDRVSPPCGKPHRARCSTTPTSRTPQADARKLVCYDCGVACDLTQMRAERLVALRKLDAHKPTTPRRRRAACRSPVWQRRPRARPHRGAGRLRAGRGRALAHPLRQARAAARSSRTSTPCAWSSASSGARGVEMIYSKGFHPKPQLVFAPALGLGVAALGEYCDVKIDFDGDGRALLARLRAAAPEGLVVAAVAEAGRRAIRRSRSCSSAPTGRRGCRRRRRRCAPTG